MKEPKTIPAKQSGLEREYERRFGAPRRLSSPTVVIDRARLARLIELSERPNGPEVECSICRSVHDRSVSHESE